MLGRRDRALALQPKNLAVRRMARARQAAGDEPDVAAEVVGRAQVDEALLDRSFTEEHRRGRALARDLLHARHDQPVEP
jgi:hypothetical protein